MLVATELEKSDRNIETNDVASALVHMRHTVGVNVNDLDNRTDSTEVPRKKAKVVVEEMSFSPKHRRYLLYSFFSKP